MKTFRWMAWDEQTKRLELDGAFTAADLRVLAAWMDNPEHPLIDGTTVMKVELSKL